MPSKPGISWIYCCLSEAGSALGGGPTSVRVLGWVQIRGSCTLDRKLWDRNLVWHKRMAASQGHAIFTMGPNLKGWEEPQRWAGAIGAAAASRGSRTGWRRLALAKQYSQMRFTRGRWRTAHAPAVPCKALNTEMPWCTFSDKYGSVAQAGKTSNCLPGCCSGAHWFVPICLLSCPPTDLTIILMPICLIVGFSIPPLLSEILQEFQFGIRLSFQGIRFSGLPFFFFYNAS